MERMSVRKSQGQDKRRGQKTVEDLEFSGRAEMLIPDITPVTDAVKSKCQ